MGVEVYSQTLCYLQGRIKGWAQGAWAPGHPPKGDKRGHPPNQSNCTHREMRLLIRAETRTV